MGICQQYEPAEDAVQNQLLDRICLKKAQIFMPRQMPPLNALRAFEAAGRHESFSRAAEELGVAHSAISRHVRGLEDRLGTQLFRDLPRGVALTQAGARFLAELTPSFDRIAEASEALRERPSGVITLSSEVLFASKILLPRLGDFQQRHPKIEIRLDASRALIDIDRYEADLAIRYYADAVPDIPHMLLSNAPMQTFAAPSLLKTPLEHPRALLRYPLLTDRSGHPWGRWFAGIKDVDPTQVPEPGWRMRAALAIDAAVYGQGVILIASDLVDAELRAGRLVRCFDHALCEGGYYLLAGDGVMRRKPVRLFRDWLLDQSAQFRQVRHH